MTSHAAVTLVQSIHGTATVQRADGRIEPLKVGDAIYPGDQVLTPPNSAVELRVDETGDTGDTGGNVDKGDTADLAAVTGDAPAWNPAPSALGGARPGLAGEDSLEPILRAIDQQDPQAVPAAGGGDAALAEGLRVGRVVEGVGEGSLAAGFLNGTPPTLLNYPTDPAGAAVPANPAPPSLEAGSSTVAAREQGVPVGLNLPAPTWTGGAEPVITVVAVPAVGQVLTAAGVLVTAGSALAAAELQGLVYRPPADYGGEPVGEFVYSASRGELVAMGQASITLSAVNDLPVALATPVVGAEDTAMPVSLAATDVDGVVRSITVTSVPEGGRLYLADGTTPVLPGRTLAPEQAASLVFVPAPQFNGLAQIGFTATDDEGGTSSPAWLPITITPVQDAPVATADTAATSEDSAVSGNVINGNVISGSAAPGAPAGKDFDADGDSLRVTGVSVSAATGGPTGAVGQPLAGQYGSLVLQPDGAYLYTPGPAAQALPAGASAVDTFSYTVSDGAGGTAQATLTINVTGVNDAAIISGTATGTVTEDAVLSTSGRLTATDIDDNRDDNRDGNATFVPVSSAGAFGTLALAADGSWTYVLNNAAPAVQALAEGDVRIETFQVFTADGTPQTLTITLHGSNDAPTVSHTAASGLEDASAPIAITLSGRDIDGAVTGYTLAALPAHGVLYLDAAGTQPVTAGMLLPASGPLTLYFQPAPQWNGDTGFDYVATDAQGARSASASAVISIVAVNDPPVAQADVAATPINVALNNINVLGNDLDVDGQPLSVTTASVNPAQGSVSINPDGTLNFNPAANVSGPVNVSYSISDGHGGTATATLVVNVGGSTPPTGANATQVLPEDGSATLLPADFGFADADAGQVLAAVRIDTLPAGGALTLGGVPVVAGQLVPASALAAGQLVFTPVANGNGSSTFNFSVQDSGGTFDTTPNTHTFTVTPVNDAPVNTVPAAQTTGEDTPLVFSTANGNRLSVADVDGDTLTTTLIVSNGTLTVGAATGVTVSGNGTGAVQITGSAAQINAALDGSTFRNAADAHGPATLTMTSTDGVASTAATVALTVTAVADIAGDVATTQEDSPVAISVLANDSFEGAGRVISAVDGVAISVGGAAVAVSNGTVTLNATGQLVFAPTSNYNGPASFTYTVLSGGVTETATVNVTVSAVNDAPVNTVPGAQATAEDSPLIFSSANGNALTVADVDGGTLTTTLAVSTGTLNLGATAGVTVSGNGTGSVQLTGTAAAINAALNGTVFNNTADRNGAATLTVTTSDGAASDVDSVALAISAVADIANDSASTQEDTPVAIAVLANDSFESASRVITEVNGSALTAGGAAVAVANGTVALNASGQLVFASMANYNGLASFTYTVASGGVTETATVNVTVSSVNDAPVNTTPSAQITAEDSPLIFSSANGNALTVGDVDGGTLTTTVAVTQGTLTLGSAAGITVSGNGTGSVQITGTAAAINAALNGTAFTSPADFNGASTLTVTTTDGAATDVDSVALNIAAVVDIAGDDATTNEDNSVAISVLANDSFEGAGRVITAVNGSAISSGGGAVVIANGSVMLNATGQLVFTPATNYSGPASFTYTVASGGVTETATVNVTVNAVNDAPVNTTPGAQTTAEDGPLIFSSANGNALTVADVDGGTLTTTLAVSTGTLNLGNTAGVTVSGNGTGSIQLTGTAAAINAALDGTVFNNTADYNGAATLTVTTSDGVASDIDSVALTVTAVADIANDSATTNEDSPVAISVLANDSFENAGRTISAVNGNAITAGGAAVAVANGAVTLNAAGQLVFTPTANYNGPASFTYTVASAGVTETATVNVTVDAVNDAPVNTTPGAQTAAEDSPLVFSSANGNALTVADLDGGTLTTTLAVTHGTLTLGSAAGVAVIGNGTGSVQITGTAAAINAALNGTAFANTADYNGSATLTVTTSDGAASDIDSVALTVSAVADIADDSATVNEDSSVAIAVLTNDSFESAGRTITEVNGSVITAGGAAVSVAHGAVTLNAAGQLVFAPTSNYNGPASFTYTVASGGVTETATVNVTVNSVNDAPVNTTPGAQTTTEDGPLIFSSTNGNALAVADVDGGTLTTTVAVTQGTLTLGSAAGVTVSGNGTGSVQITGTAAAINAALNGTVFNNTTDYNGAATLTVTTSDGVASDIDSVALTVTAVADIANDSASVNEDSAVAISVLANDSFEGAGRVISAVNGSAITVGGAAVAVANGSVTLNAIGQLVFAPTANYNGQSSFTYTVASGGVTETATVNVTVGAVNDAPINTTPGAQTAAEDSPLIFSSANGNALAVADVDGGTLTTTLAVTHGTLSLGSAAGVTVSGNGTSSVQITGTAAAINAALNGTAFNNTADYNGAATLTVTTSDGAASDIDSVALTVTAVADVANDSVSTNEDTSVSISVLANDSFEDTGRVISAVNGSAISAGGPAVAVVNGTVTLNVAGQLVFTPAADYNGPASFTYTVASGGVAETATVNVTVNPVNDGPVARADVGTTTEDSTLTVSANNGVLQSAAVAAGRDSDAEGDALLVSGITFGSVPGAVGSALEGAYGSLTLNADGSYRYAPGAAAQTLDSGERAVDVFTYTVSDGHGGTATTTLSITVTGANDAPQVVADVGSTPEDTPVSGNVLANDSDVDVEPLTVTQFTVAGVAGSFAAGQTATITGVGTLTISDTGAYTFTPAANYNGAVPVATYSVTDGSASVNGTLTLNVTPVNDAPIVISETVTTREDTPVSGNVLANDRDVDSAALSVSQFSVAGITGSFNAGQTATMAGVGTLTIAADGSYTFTPAANHSGTVPVATYTVSDGAGGAATATLNLTITSVVDTPHLVVASGNAALVVSAASWESAANSNSTSEQVAATSLDGWTRVDGPDAFAGGTNAIEVWTTGDSQQREDGNDNTVVASAGNGDNFVELNNASALVQTLALSQQVSTVAGMVYQLSLDYAGRPGFSADFTRIGVYLDGVLIQQFAATSPMGYADWHNLQFSFAGDGAAHELTIRTDATQFNAAGRGAFVDDLQIIGMQGLVAGNAGGGATTSVGLAGYVTAALADGDGSESLSLTFSGVPAGAVIVTSASPGGHAASGGSITIAGSELASAHLQFGATVTGHISLGVVATSTEVADGSLTASASAPLQFDVLPAFTSTNLAGDGLTNIVGTTGSETLNGGNGAEYLLGRAGNDALNGGGGNDVLDGGTGNDSLNGGSGNDVLYGGAGDDALTGGSGADVFRWTLADRGTTGHAANDTVADFTTGAGGDSLNLSDLLVGENAGNLDNYLHFSSVGTGTVVQISATGGFAAGFNAGAIDQTITLQGVDLGAAGTLNTQQIIDQLLANGNLKVNG